MNPNAFIILLFVKNIIMQLFVNKEHNTYTIYIYIFTFQICTYHTCTYIIVYIIYCVFAILYISILLFLLSVFCPVAVILLQWSFCHYNIFLVCVNIPSNKAYSHSHIYTNPIPKKLGHCTNCE